MLSVAVRAPLSARGARQPTKGLLREPLYISQGRGMAMSCVAVFVDAGYLFAQGSTALSGSKKPRTDLKLNETAVMAELTGAAQAKSPGCSLLRVYWYDGALSPRLTLEHSILAHMDYKSFA